MRSLLHGMRSAVRASALLSTCYKNEDLDEVVLRLRRDGEAARSSADVTTSTRVARVLARVLPPRTMGLCVRRSLILLHVWASCGVEAQLHLGVTTPGRSRAGHAWLSVEHERLQPYAGTSRGYREAITL